MLVEEGILETSRFWYLSQLILSMGPYLSAPSAEKPRSKGGQDFCLRELFIEQAGVGKAPRSSSLRAAPAAQSNRRGGAFGGTKGEDPFHGKGILQVVDGWTSLWA